MLIYRLNNSYVHPPIESLNDNKTFRMCQDLYKCLGGGGYGELQPSHSLQRAWKISEHDQMNVKNRNLVLTEINLWQRITRCMFPFLWNSTTDELTCARRHQSSGCFAKGEDDKGTFFMLREWFSKQWRLCTWGLYLSWWNNLLGAKRLIKFACVGRNK